MITELHPVLRRQLGVVSRQQMLACGLSPSQVDRLERSGTLERVQAGVFRHTATPTTWEQRLMAGLLGAGPASVVSHRSAAALWGVPNLSVAMVELTRPGTAPVRRRELHVHRNQLSATEWTDLGPLRLTTPARTAVDLATVVSPVMVGRAIETWLSGSIMTIDQLTDALARAGRRHGTRIVRELMLHRQLGRIVPDSRAEGVLGETLAAGGLPLPVHHHIVVLPDGTRFELDWAYPADRLALELDGHGVHPASFEAFDRDRWRRNELEIHGWTVLNFTSAACRRQPRRVVEQVRRVLLGRQRPPA